MADMVEQYVDEVVETRRRTVHVLEDCVATLSAWHGGHRLCDLNSRTSVAAAVRTAGEAAAHFGIEAGSSLTLRVEEAVTRSWRAVRAQDARGRVEYETQCARPSVAILTRHAWDSRAGFLEPDWRAIPFRFELWIGLMAEAPPTQLLRACYAGVEVHRPHERWLYEGFGLGGASLDTVEIDEGEPHAGVAGREGVLRFLRVRLSGACRVSVPPGADLSRLAAFLDACDPHVLLDPNVEEAIARYGRRPVFWVGAPAARLAWGGLRLEGPCDADA